MMQSSIGLFPFTFLSKIVLALGMYQGLMLDVLICSENDNVPMFYQSEIELKFNEKIVNGYQIPFVGAKDIDEGPHSQIFYFLDCSPSIGSPIENQSFSNNNQTKSLSKNCSPLFELLILSQSSSTSSSHYDQLALKYRPSTKLAATRHEYHLILYAMDQHFTGHRRETSMKITVKIEEKEKFLKFSLSNYEFVLTLNGTMNERVSVGRVYAMTNDPSERIHYQLISTMIQNKKTKDLVEINTFTGELFLQKRNLSKLVDEIQCHVQGSILHNKKSVESVQVKIYLRYVELLSEIFFDFQILSLNYLKMINTKDDHSSFNYSFFLDENIEPKETNLLQISLHSSFYPSDRYLLSLETYSKIFSLVSSSTSSSNVYQLQIKNLPQLRDQNTYELQFPVKHQLSQQWFSNLYIQLTLVDSLTTSTTTTTTTTTTTITTTTTMTTVSSTTAPLSEPDEQYDEDPIFAETKTIPWITLPIFTQPMSTERTAEMIEDTSDRSNSSTEWCNENHEYILYDIEPIGYLRVIEFTSIGSHNSSLLDGSSSIMVIRPLNENELMIEGCRMFIEPVNSAHFNRSVNLQLCSTVPAVPVCYNVTSMNPEPMKSIHEEMDVEEGFLSVRSIEIIISVISVIFVIISIILVFIICRLKGLNLCRMVQHYFYDHRYSFKRTPHLSSIKQTMVNIGFNVFVLIADNHCLSYILLG